MGRWFCQEGRISRRTLSRESTNLRTMITAATAGADAAGNAYVATGTDFIVTCGCDGVVSPTPTTTTSSAATAAPMGRGLDLTPAPAGSSTSSVAPGQTLAPAAASPIPTSQPSSSPGAVANPGACAEASITVISSEFPLLEGCFLEADLEVQSLEGGESEYVGGQTGLIYAGGVQGEEGVSARMRFRECAYCAAAVVGSWHATSVR